MALGGPQTWSWGSARQRRFRNALRLARWRCTVPASQELLTQALHDDQLYQETLVRACGEVRAAEEGPIGDLVAAVVKKMQEHPDWIISIIQLAILVLREQPPKPQPEQPEVSLATRLLLARLRKRGGAMAWLATVAILCTWFYNHWQPAPPPPVAVVNAAPVVAKPTVPPPQKYQWVCPQEYRWDCPPVVAVAPPEPPPPPKKKQELLVFGATWCGPCRGVHPMVKALSLKDVTIREIDIDREPELKKKYDVTNIPCFVFVVDGQETGRRIIGTTTRAKLLQLTQQP